MTLNARSIVPSRRKRRCVVTVLSCASLGTRGFDLPGGYHIRVLVTVDGHRVNDSVDGVENAAVAHVGQGGGEGRLTWRRNLFDKKYVRLGCRDPMAEFS